MLSAPCRSLRPARRKKRGHRHAGVEAHQADHVESFELPVPREMGSISTVGRSERGIRAAEGAAHQVVDLTGSPLDLTIWLLTICRDLTRGSLSA